MSRSLKLCFLGTLIILCAGAVVLQAALERRRKATPPHQLYAIVSQQLSAIRTDDFAGAYRQASMGFQEKCDVETFAQIARTEYPALRAAERVEFGAVRFEGHRAYLPAYFFMPEGDVLPCLYTLVWEDDGWKIDEARIYKRWPTNRRLGGTRT